MEVDIKYSRRELKVRGVCLFVCFMGFPRLHSNLSTNYNNNNENPD